MRNGHLIKELQAAIGKRWVLHAPEDLLVYEYDATIERGLPDAVVLPETTEQVASAVRIARAHGLPVTARGAGTGLSGGAIPCEDDSRRPTRDVDVRASSSAPDH